MHRGHGAIGRASPVKPPVLLLQDRGNNSQAGSGQPEAGARTRHRVIGRELCANVCLLARNPE